MNRSLRKFPFLIIILAALLVFGCASTRRNPWVKERRRSGFVSTSQLGKNKYYFSSSYQKKLSRSVRKK
jgi:hypothetical protein